MFSLSKRSRLALYVLVEMARTPGVRRSADELAATLAVSNNHLAKVMQALARQQWVRGSRGAGGGYRLVADPKRVSMADIVTLFEGRTTPGRCSFVEAESCPHERQCEIYQVVDEIEQHAFSTMRSVTVALLANPQRPRGDLLALPS